MPRPNLRRRNSSAPAASGNNPQRSRTAPRAPTATTGGSNAAGGRNQSTNGDNNGPPPIPAAATEQQPSPPQPPPQPEAAPPAEQPPPAQRQHEEYRTPAHEAARRAAKMTEEEYAQLNAHPSPDFIAMNLHQRMDAAQQSAVEAAERAQLEAQLQRQNEISGSSRPTAARSTGPQASRTPKALEFPNCPANLIYRGSTDGRQVQDWVREWDALSLYVHPDYKVAHLLTAIAEPVKQTLSAAFRTTAYNGGTGYATLTHVPYNEIIDLMKTNFDRPDYVYRAVVRWRDHKMNSSTTLEAYLRERDKLCNQLSSYGIIVDAVKSKYMLVAAVTPEHRKEMMREKDGTIPYLRPILVQVPSTSTCIQMHISSTCIQEHVFRSISGFCQSVRRVLSRVHHAGHRCAVYIVLQRIEC